MASRLTLRKKKYHPPYDEPEQNLKIDENKTNQDHSMNSNNINRSRTYVEVTTNSSKPHMEDLNLMKTKYQPDFEEPKEQTNSKTPSNKKYAQIARDLKKADIESDIFTKAKASAQKHGITLKAGRKDRGFGNCAFQSVINNLNDRECFREMLTQTPNWYRRIWMDEMKDRIIDGVCPWNLSFTENQIREGFEQLKDSGVYEVDFFGDMMIGGISCAIKKNILIFNTSENLLHDPISVVTPTQFDWRIEIDNMTPIVVAYNNYHYESLEPVDEQDRQDTIRLVHSSINDRYRTEYGFTRMDIKYLISPDQHQEKNCSEEMDAFHKEYQQAQNKQKRKTPEDISENQNRYIN